MSWSNHVAVVSVAQRVRVKHFTVLFICSSRWGNGSSTCRSSWKLISWRSCFACGKSSRGSWDWWTDLKTAQRVRQNEMNNWICSVLLLKRFEVILTCHHTVTPHSPPINSHKVLQGSTCGPRQEQELPPGRRRTELQKGQCYEETEHEEDGEDIILTWVNTVSGFHLIGVFVVLNPLCVFPAGSWSSREGDQEQSVDTSCFHEHDDTLTTNNREALSQIKREKGDFHERWIFRVKVSHEEINLQVMSQMFIFCVCVCSDL